MKTYRVKPLAWERNGDKAWQCVTIQGQYLAVRFTGNRTWTLFALGQNVGEFKKPNDAKAAAEAHYLARLLPALEPAKEPDHD